MIISGKALRLILAISEHERTLEQKLLLNSLPVYKPKQASFEDIDSLAGKVYEDVSIACINDADNIVYFEDLLSFRLRSDSTVSCFFPGCKDIKWDSIDKTIYLSEDGYLCSLRPNVMVTFEIFKKYCESMDCNLYHWGGSIWVIEDWDHSYQVFFWIGPSYTESISEGTDKDVFNRTVYISPDNGLCSCISLGWSSTYKNLIGTKPEVVNGELVAIADY